MITKRFSIIKVGEFWRVIENSTNRILYENSKKSFADWFVQRRLNKEVEHGKMRKNKFARILNE